MSTLVIFNLTLTTTTGSGGDSAFNQVSTGITATEDLATNFDSSETTWWYILAITLFFMLFVCLGYVIFCSTTQFWRQWYKTNEHLEEEKFDNRTEQSSLNSYCVDRHYCGAASLDRSNEYLVEPAQQKSKTVWTAAVAALATRIFHSRSATATTEESSVITAENYLLRNSTTTSMALASVAPNETNHTTFVSERRRSSLGMERFSIIAEHINPALYVTQDDVINENLQCHGLGRLSFSLELEVQNERLFVTVHRAAYLNSQKISSSGHFYVKVEIRPAPASGSAHARTEEVTATRNPLFETRFSFSLNSTELSNRTVEFTVKEKLSIDKKATIGIVSFPLGQFQRSRSISTISSASGGSIDSDKTDDWHTENPIFRELWREIKLLDKPNTSKCGNMAGKIFISLCYDPGRKKITVGVLECQGLCLQEGSLHIRIALQSEECVVKTKKTKTVRKGHEHAYFKQNFEFTLDEAYLSPHATKELSEKSQDVLDYFCLAFYACTTRYNRLQNKVRNYSKCVIGPVKFAESEGQLHWTDMKITPKATVYQWHSLF